MSSSDRPYACAVSIRSTPQPDRLAQHLAGRARLRLVPGAGKPHRPERESVDAQLTADRERADRWPGGDACCGGTVIASRLSPPLRVAGRLLLGVELEAEAVGEDAGQLLGADFPLTATPSGRVVVSRRPRSAYCMSGSVRNATTWPVNGDLGCVEVAASVIVVMGANARTSTAIEVKGRRPSADATALGSRS